MDAGLSGIVGDLECVFAPEGYTVRITPSELVVDADPWRFTVTPAPGGYWVAVNLWADRVHVPSACVAFQLVETAMCSSPGW